MNKTLWKLQNAGERLWLLANMMAQHSAALDVRGLAVVAEETRKMSERILGLTERALFGEEEIKPDDVRDVGTQLNLLALNSAIETSKVGFRGKPAVACVEDIRNIAYELTVLFDGNHAPKRYEGVVPYPKTGMTSVAHHNEFLLLNIGGVAIVEPVANVKEINMCDAERTDSRIKLRGMEFPLIDAFAMLGKTQAEPAYVILYTPWAEQNKTYAVAADVSCLFFSPTGAPAAAPADAPLAGYAREFWESENDMPFLFMDWPKMA